MAMLISGTMASRNPTVSVVIEGYNESQELGAALDTVEALRKQDYPLRQVEVILVGSPEQAERWDTALRNDSGFQAIRTLGVEKGQYYDLKNRGAEVARGDVIAFTDSDVRPKQSWVSSIVSGIGDGADVVVGVTVFGANDSRRLPAAILEAASSITWGFIVGKNGENGRRARSFLGNNTAFRAPLFRQHPFVGTEEGRSIAPEFLVAALRERGARIVLQPQQQVTHNFTLYWWLCQLHFRFGWETYQLRRLHGGHPRRWVRHLGPLEPPLTMAWKVVLDVLRWFDISPLLGLRPLRRLGLVPLVGVLSLLARGAELIGMYSTMLAPKRMRRYALSH